MKNLYKILTIFILYIFSINAFAITNNHIQTSTEEKLKNISTKITEKMAAITPATTSALEKRYQEESLVTSGLLGITFHRPTYILPFYYTGSPYKSVYKDNTPNNQAVKPSEFKGQLSFKFPILNDILNTGTGLNIAYTQVMYWQFYTNSQYFRETNYEPELFISKKIIPNWWANLGIDHQSNGRGGSLERSWNRTYVNLLFSNDNWMVSIKPWLLIFKNNSSNKHNPDIVDYMGHGELTFSYKLKPLVLSLMLRNNIESGFKRGAVEFDCSFPIYRYLRGYVQLFSGYGQSLIEYNHRTNSAGIGIALSDWI